MKKNRAEIKDRNDCELMDGYIFGNYLKERIARIKQYLFYTKILLTDKTNKFIRFALKRAGIYDYVKLVYRYLKGKK